MILCFNKAICQVFSSYLLLKRLSFYGAKAVNFPKLIFKIGGERGISSLFLSIFPVGQTSEFTVTHLRQSVKPVRSKLTSFTLCKRGKILRALPH